MAQISLYINDLTAEKLGVAAKARNCSISKYVASLVSERLSEEDADDARKRQLLRELRGAIKDTGFAEPSEISWEMPKYAVSVSTLERHNHIIGDIARGVKVYENGGVERRRQKTIAFPPGKSYNGHKRKQNGIKCRAGRSVASKPPHTEGVNPPTAYGDNPAPSTDSLYLKRANLSRSFEFVRRLIRIECRSCCGSRNTIGFCFASLFQCRCSALSFRRRTGGVCRRIL